MSHPPPALLPFFTNCRRIPTHDTEFAMRCHVCKSMRIVFARWFWSATAMESTLPLQDLFAQECRLNLRKVMAGVNEEERKWVVIEREKEEGEEEEEEEVVVVGEGGEMEGLTPEGKKARCWECGHRYCNGDRRERQRQRQKQKRREEEEEEEEGGPQDVDDQDGDGRDYHSYSRLNNGRNDDDNEEREETGNGANDIVDDEDDDLPRNACDLGLRYLCWICWSCETRNRYEANQPWDSLRCSHCRYFRNGACGWAWKPEVLENDWGYEDGPIDGAYDVDEEDGEEEKDERRWRRVGASHWVKMNIVRKVSDSGGGGGHGGGRREDVRTGEELPKIS